MNTGDTFMALTTYKIPRVFGALCQERGSRPTIYFLLQITISQYKKIKTDTIYSIYRR